MEFGLKSNDEVDTFRVLVESLKNDLNCALISLDNESSSPTNNIKMESLKLFLEAFKTGQINLDTMNYVCILYFLYLYKLTRDNFAK